MKSNYWIIVICLVCGACSGLKTREEAAQEAKTKAASGSEPSAAAPIDEDENGPVGAAAGPMDDEVLNDELAALGIDPNSINEKQKTTPEPEAKSRTKRKASAKLKPKRG